MRKVLLLTLEYPPMRGGIAEYLGGIFGALPKEKVTVLHCEKFFWKKGVPFRWLPSIWNSWKAARANRSEVIVVSHVLPMGYVAYLLKLSLRLPYIVIAHGMDLKLAQMNRRKKRLAGLVMRNAETVVVNSKYTRSIALELGVKEGRVKVVYPCPSKAVTTKPDSSQVEDLRKLYGLESRKVILSIGRLVKRKGFDCIIELLPRIRSFCGDAIYLIVGTGPEEENLKRLANKKGVKDAVVFVGSVDGKDIPAHYMLGDVFVTVSKELPGDVEGFGIVYLEAGLYGLPVVAGRTGGVPEAVLDGKTGILVDSESDDEIVSAVRGLLTNTEEARRLGENGRIRVDEEFSCARPAELMKALL